MISKALVEGDQHTVCMQRHKASNRLSAKRCVIGKESSSVRCRVGFEESKVIKNGVRWPVVESKTMGRGGEGGKQGASTSVSFPPLDLGVGWGG